MGKILNYVALFVLLLILSLAVGYLLPRHKVTTETNKPSGYIPSLQYSKRIVLRESKLNFSEITSTSVIDKSELPQELQLFVVRKLINQTYQRIQYSDGKNGYLIEYTINALDYKKEGNLSALYWLSKEYIDLAKAARWNTAFLSRTNLFALVELENSNYK